jgi:ethanolamine ammonia-lyase small subunit
VTALVPDAWRDLRRLTPARIALGRAGASLPTGEALAFALAHAQARDAVHAEFEAERLAGEIEALGWPTLSVASAAPDRATYLSRPDLGRRLSAASREALANVDGLGRDLAIVVADGLSAKAVNLNAAPLLRAVKPFVERARLNVAPVVLAHQARVALGDEIGELLRARLMILLVGERPGLSSSDSLGIYLTFGPRAGRTDGERNCISNVREAGLMPEQAAFKLAWLVERALALGASGVRLKDESGAALAAKDFEELIQSSDGP